MKQVLPDIEIAELDADAHPDAVDQLADVLRSCVLLGASVGFVQPFTQEDAEQFWRDKVLPSVASGARCLWVARHAGRIIGTVQLGLDLPANQPHRGDVAKLLVHPEVRRLGVARQLMEVLINHAASLGKTLLVLDTRSGDPSQRLYESLGFRVSGTIPDFCIHPDTGALEATTILYRHLP